MKKLYLQFFFLLLSCNSTKKNYVCGDRPCLNKKDFNEYFANNLSIEIKSYQYKKIKNVDLIELNTKILNSKAGDKKLAKKNLKLRKKVEKEKLKAEKKILSKVSKSNNSEKKTVKIKTDDKTKQVKNIVDKPIFNKENKNKIVNNEVKVKSVKSQNIKSACYDVADCDIDKIAEKLIKKGREKPFPNITSN